MSNRAMFSRSSAKAGGAAAMAALALGAFWSLPESQAVARNGEINDVVDIPLLVPAQNIPPLPQIPDAQVREPVDLPIVSNGFASDKQVAGSLAPLIEALRSSVYQERDQATQSLLRLPPDRLSEVVSALERENDSEAVARLTQVAVHLYLKSRTPMQRPSLLGLWFKEEIVSMLGLRFKQESVRIDPHDENLTSTIAVTELQPGFPAYQTLRLGDRIVGINGKRFQLEMDEMEFPTRVRKFWPGAILHLTVLRDGRLSDIDVQIAGVAYSGLLDLQSAIDERAQAAAAFVKGLKTGEKRKPLIMEGSAVEAVRWMGPGGDWGGGALPVMKFDPDARR